MIWKTLISAEELAGAIDRCVVVDCRHDLLDLERGTAQLRRRPSSHRRSSSAWRTTWPGRRTAATAGIRCPIAKRCAGASSRSVSTTTGSWWPTTRMAARWRCGSGASRAGSGMKRQRCSTATSARGGRPAIRSLPKRRLCPPTPAASVRTARRWCRWSTRRRSSRCSSRRACCWSMRARRNATPERSSRSIRSPAISRAPSTASTAATCGPMAASSRHRCCATSISPCSGARTRRASCTSAAPASPPATTCLAMEHAGLAGARLYPGSWSEWVADPARPVARS